MRGTWAASDYASGAPTASHQGKDLVCRKHLTACPRFDSAGAAAQTDLPKPPRGGEPSIGVSPLGPSSVAVSRENVSDFESARAAGVPIPKAFRTSWSDNGLRDCQACSDSSSVFKRPTATADRLREGPPHASLLLCRRIAGPRVSEWPYPASHGTAPHCRTCGPGKAAWRPAASSRQGPIGPDR